MGDTKTLVLEPARGSTAARFLAEIVAAALDATRWDVLAIGPADRTVLAFASSGDVDEAALRNELRLQRFAGFVLPHVGTALSAESRRVLFVVFGPADDRVCVLRIERAPAAKPFIARDGASVERLLRRSGDVLAGAIFGDEGEFESIVAGRTAPLSFLIDPLGHVLSAPAPGGEDDEVAAQLLPIDGHLPVLLEPLIIRLLDAWHAGARGDELTAVLPFAILRLMPLRSRHGDELLVSIEWLRSRASLEVAASRYAISKRELQVLSSMLRGAAVAEIAAELSISESTVIFHLKRMLKKTSAKNRTELAARMLGYEIPA